MAVNYAEQYSAELAQAYPYTLYFGDLWNSKTRNRYKVVDAKTIKIPHINTKGRVDGSRDSLTSFTRNWDNDWETKELKRHRSWQTLVHPQDVDQTNTVATIANITAVFNQDQKFPEMDAILVSSLYTLKNDLEAVKAYPSSGFTEETVLVYFDAAMKRMNNARVPRNGRICYVDTDTKELLDRAFKLYRSNGDNSIKREVNDIDGVKIVAVPPELMMTAYDFTEGWVVAEGAKQIKMMLVHPSAVLPVCNYAFAQLSAPSAMSQGKYVYFEESFEDVFILNEKHDGIQIIICEDSTSVLGTLNVTSAADETLGSSVITVTPEAADGNTFVYKLGKAYTSFTCDDVLSSDVWTPLPDDGVIACGSYTKITVAEVTADYRAVARGTAPLVKKE